MIIKKFEEIVGHFPGRAALKTGSKSLTYAELNFYANRVAHAAAVKDKETGPGVEKQQVALLFEYGIDMIVGLLGALKANKTYVPLDFSYPEKRLLYILEDAEAYLILTDNRNHDLASELSAHAGKKIDVLNINTIGDEIPGTAIPREASAERTAYILYTSGSTGKPKGVMQIHRNVLYYTRNWINRFSITESERMSLFTSFTHDGAVQDIFSALLSGACLYPYSLKESGSVEELYRLLTKEKITLWHSTPSLFRYFTGVLTGEAHFPDVRWVLLGGEPLRAHDLELYKTYFGGAVLANVYGQTESSVSSICVISPRDTFDDVTLGEPLDETRIFLMDEDGDMVEEMGGGEIVVACEYIAPGYWQDEENSEKVFLHDEQRGRLYRTGDMGRFTAQGSIKAMGRKDFQVKIRGYRIELGEIETGLLRHYAVKEAIVIARPDETGDNYLCAYILTSQSVSSEDLRKYLFSELPDYMVPRYFIFLEKLPLNSSGKIDRRRLPEPGKVMDSRSLYIAPSDEIEEKVAAIWQEVLKVEKIGVNDNFTELGGHSLLVMTIISKIHQELHVELKLTDVFSNPTVKELSRLVKESKPTIFSSIEPVEEKEYYLLSSAQKRLYILQQMNPGSTAYNLPEIIPLLMGSDWRKIEEVFRGLINRHESLRTSFHMINDTPVQRVHEEVEFEIEYYDLSADYTDYTDYTERAAPTAQKGPSNLFQKDGPEAVIKSFIRPFDLSQAPLLRVGLLKTGEDSRLLLVDMYHIISDGVSLEILAKDYQALYNEEKIPPLRVHYKDFSVWQKGKREKENLNQQEEYWLKEFEGEIPVLDLPYDYPRPVEQSFEGNRVNFEIPGEETRALKVVALQGGTTLFMVLTAVFNILLSKLSGQEEIIIGTPIASRRHTDLEKIIGMFVNTLALRNYPVGDRSFKDFLCDVKERLLMVFENQEYPFEELVDKLSVKRDIGRNPLFDVMFVSQNMGTYSVGQDKETGFEASRSVQPAFLKEYENINQTAKFDLTLTAMERDPGLFLLFVYCTKLFKKETIERFILYFKKIVSKVVKEPDIRISDIEIVPGEEKNRILKDFSQTEAVYPKDKTIHRLFEEQAVRTPDNIALHGCMIAWMQGEEGSITYKELNEKSNRLAYVLQMKNMGPDTVAGIMVERSVEMIIGIFGILKAGGAYLPIDPEYPADRIEYMLKDSGAKILVTSDNLAKEGEKVRRREGEKNLEIVFLDTVSSPALLNFGFPNFLTSPPPNFAFLPVTGHRQLATSLAYIIYTSGTTGRPKGVLVEHSSVVNLLYAMQNLYPFGEGDVYLLKTSYVFDVSVTELFGWYLGGGRVTVLEVNGHKDPLVILDTIERERVTHINFVPSMFDVFLEQVNIENVPRLSSLKYIFLAGEQLLPRLATRSRDLNTTITLENIYGPTESTVYASKYSIVDWSGSGSIPIGKPLPNIRLYILNKNDQVQPLGLAGELCIDGVGLARGYLNRPELTAEKFLFLFSRFNWSYMSNKSYINPKKRFYQTGDLSRWLPDGNIEFLGRIDHQVKIRGFRVELGEIESRLLNYPGIREVVAVLREDVRDDKYICAYFVSDSEYGISELREYLSRGLPDYMIPSYFVQVAKIPLTPSGKIDRKALPVPGIKVGDNHEAPRDRIEKKLRDIWAGVLGIEKEKIGINDNFFQMGGHSLKATIMVSRIHRELKVKVPLTEVFKSPTIRGLAGFIKGAVEYEFLSINKIEEKEYYPLSSAQKRLYILQQMALDSTGYNMPSIMVLQGDLNRGKIEDTFKKLLHRHESLRTSFEMIEGEPVQRIHEKVDFQVENFKLQVQRYWGNGGMGEWGDGMAPFGQILNAFGEDTSLTLTRDTNTIIKDFIRPFDLSKALLIRVGLIKSEPAKYILMTDMHHIIADGVSISLLAKDFAAFFSGLELPVLKIQYIDYSTWQNSKPQRESIKKSEEYWLKQLEGELPVLNLPTDYVRPVIQGFEGAASSFEIDLNTASALKSLAFEQGATLYILLLSLYMIFLAKLSNQEDIVVGTPVAGRRHSDLEGIIGMFVNTLALRNYPLGERTFAEFLQDIKENTLKAFENQDYQYEDLVEHVGVNRDASRNPLFDTMFVLQNIDTTGINIPGLKLSPYKYENQTSKFDLTLSAAEAADKLLFTFEYSTKLFTEATISRFIAYFKKIIASVLLESPKDIKLSAIEIISTEEKRQILIDFNDTETEYPKDKTLHWLFAEQVEKAPDHTALVGPKLQITNYKQSDALGADVNTFGGGHLSYRELNYKADRLAHLLIEKGVQTDTIAGIMMERSVEMIIGIFGILKAGGAYLPIDPEYPGERIAYMLKESSANILLSDRKDVGTGHCPVLILDIIHLVHGEFGIQKLGTGQNNSTGTGQCPVPTGSQATGYWLPATSLAYVIYTSGTTGKPKGIMINHNSVVNLLMALQKKYPLSPADAYLFKTSFNFDVSVSELFGWFLDAGRLVILGKNDHKDPRQIIAAIEQFSVTHMNFVPSMFKVFLEGLSQNDIKRLSSLRHLFLAGEALPPSLVLQWQGLTDKVTLENCYGPTEACVYASTYSLTPWENQKKSTIPIGQPLPNIELYIVDQGGQWQPIGISGELCIAGAGLARGYLNKPGLTAKRFCLRQPGGFFSRKPPPWTPRKSFLYEKFLEGPGNLFSKRFPGRRRQKIYKTGDLARWLERGDIEFLGRLDRQVKVRGFRIELAEIENHLLHHSKIKDAVVTAREEQRETYLAAYIIPKGECNIAEYREYLLHRLPEYMIPSYFMMLEQLPLTPSGKIDSKALPQPGITLEQPLTGPRNQIERQLQEIWSEVLRIDRDRVGIDTNFFQWGGHSLKAMAIVSKIHHRFNVRLPLTEIFKTPHIRGLAKSIQNRVSENWAGIKAVEKKEYYPLSSPQKRMFFMNRVEGICTTYNMPMAMKIEGNVDPQHFKTIFQELTRRHESLRTSFTIAKGLPVQVIHETTDFQMEIKGIHPQTSGDNYHNYLLKDTITNFIKPFSLDRAPLLRVILVCLTKREYLLVIDTHHIIADGLSLAILVKEFLLLYQGKQLPYLLVQYKDAVQWQNNRFESEQFNALEKYWLNRFSGELPTLQLKSGPPSQVVPNFAGETVNLEIHPELTEKIKKVVNQTQTTQFIFLLAVFTILLSKYSEQEDIIVGSTIAGRTHQALEHVVGMFVNLIALRNYPSKEKIFKDYLKEVARDTLIAFENQDWPFEELVKKLNISSSSRRNPLFNVVFSFENLEIGRLDIPGLKCERYELENKIAHFDLVLHASGSNGVTRLALEFSKALFEPAEAQTLLKHYVEILEQVVENQYLQLKDLNLSHGILAPRSDHFQKERFDFKF